MTNPFEVINARLQNIEALILNLHDRPANQAEQDKWMDIDELIEYIPDHPAKPTVYGLVHRRKIPYYKKGKKLFFKKSEINSYLAEGKRKTVKEMAEEI